MVFLTVEQFAERLQVSRTTVFEWIKTGALEEGIHYFKIGRVLRFGSDEALFLKVGRVSSAIRKKPTPKPIKPKEQRRQRSSSHQAINLDY